MSTTLRRGRRDAEQAPAAASACDFDAGQGARQPIDETHLLGNGVSGDQRGDVAIFDDVGELRRPVAGVDGHDHGAAQRGGEENLDECRTGVHQDADAIARLHTECLQTAGRSTARAASSR
jgi:hypothetical protein